MKRKLITLQICLLAILFSIQASRAEDSEQSEEYEAETAGWITAGERFYLDPESDLQNDSGGRFFRFTSSMQIRSLLTFRDTLWIGTEGGLFGWDRMNDSLFSAESFPFSSVRVMMLDDYERLWVGCDEGICLRNAGWKYYTSCTHPFFKYIRDITPGNKKVWIATYGNGCGYISGDSMTVFTEKDSLIDNRVLSIIEETSHQLWFGTASGVCRADSFRWEPMRYGTGIPLGSINDMIFDEGKNLFIAVRRQGVSRYKFGSVKSYSGEKGLPGWNINEFSLAMTGYLMAAGDGGLSYYDGSGWTPYRLPGIPLGKYSFLSIHHDLSDNIYLGTDDGLVILAERDGTREIRLPQSFPSARVMKIIRSGDRLFFITGGGLYLMEEELSRVDLPDEWYSSAVTGVASGSEGELWISTRFGILHYSGNRWEVFDRRNGLPTEYVTCTAYSSKGALWFGTFENGVLRFAGDRWYHFTRENGLPDDRVSDMRFDAAGKLWLLTVSGHVAFFSNGIWVEVQLAPVRSTVAAEDSTGEELTMRSVPGLRYLSTLEKGTGMYGEGICLGEGLTGNCVIARRDGIFINYGKEWSRISLPLQKEELIPTAIIGTGGAEYWLGTKNRGLFILREGEWIDVGVLSGFPSEEVMSLRRDSSGSIWIGTASSGVFRFSYQGEEFEGRIPER